MTSPALPDPPSQPPAAAPPAPLPRAPKARWLLLRGLWSALLALSVAVPVLLALAAWAVLHTEPGTRWLLPHLPGLEVHAPRGALLGPEFAAERIRLRWDAGRQGVDIEQVELRGARWRWWVRPTVWASLEAEALTARSVRLDTGPHSTTPLHAPADLHLPLALQIRQLSVGEWRVDQLPPWRSLSASVWLEGEDGRQHRLEGLSFGWDRLHAQGRATVDTGGPMTVHAVLNLEGTAAEHWTGRVQASGPLTALRLQGELRGGSAEGAAGASSRMAQEARLDATAEVKPFAPWPLGPLEATAQGLNLAALATGLPVTRLSGQARVTSQGAGAPLDVSATVDNALPGRWSDGRLPLRRLQAQAQAPQAQAGNLALKSFEVQLADERQAAGLWRGQAQWQGALLSLDSQLSDLRPRGLDERAPAMRVSGPLALTVRGVTADEAALRERWRAATLEVRSSLEGVLDSAPQPVAVTLQARASAQQLDITRLSAQSRGASAELSAWLQQAGPLRWQARTEGRLAGFDPVAWFPGTPGSAWRRGPHRLNASWKADVSAPRGLLKADPVLWLQSLQGTGSLQVENSQVAGVSMQGYVRLRQDDSSPAGQRSHMDGEMRLGRNLLGLSGTGDPSGAGENDRWQLALQGEALADLAPLAALDPELARWVPRGGRATAQLTAEGRWPRLRTQGSMRLDEVQAGELQLARGQAQWNMATGADEPVNLTLELQDARLGLDRAAWVRAEVQGTARAHRLGLTLASPWQPSAAVQQALDLGRGSGTQARLSGTGQWDTTSDGGGVWRGRIDRASAGSWDGKAQGPERADGAWLDVSELRAQVRFNPEGAFASAQADAGQATLAGGVPLRWEALAYQRTGERADFQFKAQAGPVLVAPFLQRAGSGLNWSGDLRLGARLEVHAADRFEADLSVSRLQGDLQVTDGGLTQAMGLSELDISLRAREGTWTLTPRLAGSSLGRLQGEFRLQTAAADRWPPRNAPLSGSVALDVPNLGIWAGWVPPGWRIGGALSTRGSLGGRFAAPQVTGEIGVSALAVRNPLLGVDFNDGQARVALNGDTARIERLSLRGGDGSIQAEGSAVLGESPAAELRVKASQFRVIGRVDRQLVASGEGTLRWQPQGLQAQGRLMVDSGLFDLSSRDAPGLDEDVVVQRATPVRQEAARDTPAAARPNRSTQVALDIDLGERLRLRGRGLDTHLRGQLQVSTPAGRLAINGTVRADSGTYAAYGQRLEIERGFVIFNGPAEGARLDILALRPNLDTRVGVAIGGSALNPRVRLYSEPEMSETDKLSWLVLGRGSEGLGRSDTTVLQRAAMALIAGEGEGPTDSLLRAIGLDNLSLRQGEGEVRETIISLGKQLSQRWYVGYERGVNATSGTFQLIYRIAQRFTLRAQSGLENSLDLIWTWRFDRL